MARRRAAPRAVGLTVTLEPVRLNARLNISGLPAGTDTYSITRTGPSGVAAGVRGATDATASGTTAIERDYEVPLGVPVVYTVTAYDGSTAVGSASANFEVVYSDCEAWITDLARPLNSLPLTIESLAELAFESAAGVHRVLNRRAPVMTNLPAWTPAAELIVLTDDLEERDRVRSIFGSGYPVLVRTAPEMGIGNIYFGLTDFSEERILTPGVAAQRRFRASCIQVERPDPGIFVPVAPNDYANVKATYADYAALKAGVPDYDGLAYSYPSGSVGPIIPWLPDDV